MTRPEETLEVRELRRRTRAAESRARRAESERQIAMLAIEALTRQLASALSEAAHWRAALHLRGPLGHTGAELAMILGVQPGVVSRFMSGGSKRRPGESQIMRERLVPWLAQLTGIPGSDLARLNNDGLAELLVKGGHYQPARRRRRRDAPGSQTTNEPNEHTNGGAT